MKLDLDKEKKLTLKRLLELVLLCFAGGAGITLLNEDLGYVVIGFTILVFLLPVLLDFLKGD